MIIMKKVDLKNSSFVMNENSLIRDAMGAITDNQRGTIIVIDDSFYFQGLATDGDIRRGMLKGATMETPISKIINTNPVVINKNGDINKKAEEIFKADSSISVIPIVDDNNILIDIKTRDPKKRKEI